MKPETTGKQASAAREEMCRSPPLHSNGGLSGRETPHFRVFLVESSLRKLSDCLLWCGRLWKQATTSSYVMLLQSTWMQLCLDAQQWRTSASEWLKTTLSYDDFMHLHAVEDRTDRMQKCKCFWVGPESVFGFSCCSLQGVGVSIWNGALLAMQGFKHLWSRGVRSKVGISHISAAMWPHCKVSFHCGGLMWVRPSSIIDLVRRRCS